MEFIFTQILTNDIALPESFEGTWLLVNRQYMHGNTIQYIYVKELNVFQSTIS